MNKDAIQNLKFFLKEMFQFNENDLDFGIYKIYNLKRKHIEGFIEGEGENDLTPTIEKILREVNLENQKTDSLDLFNFLKGKNMEALLNEPEANYGDIQLAFNFEKDPNKKAKLVESLQKMTQSDGLTDALKDKIYNHILGFFQMYYSNGDFGYNDRSRDLYKVPYEADYNGSDTMFHWKHKGSLYIKTGTAFNAIKFELNGLKIEYRLETVADNDNENTARNNNKDTQLKHYQFNRIEEKDGAFHVVFNLSDASSSKTTIFKAVFNKLFGAADIDKYLQYEKDGKTKTVFTDLDKDFDKVQNGQIKGLSALRQTKAQVAKEAKNNFERGIKLYDENTKELTDDTLNTLYTLDKKLNSFYIGNDADYFIHENLHQFLTNEKQRFIKNYIFDDLESIYNGKLDNTTLLIAKAFDRVSSRIIEFLSAIEDFQKHLFTKKKKVLVSEYCITLDYVDAALYPEILANAAQLQEWKDLFGLDIQTETDLKDNPTLVLDTKFFAHLNNGSNPFKDKLLATIDDLDEKTNGLLINSENYQALELLQTKFKEKIKTIYIDPPYNTGGDGFVYKDNFRHSSWLSFMYNRLFLGKQLLSNNGGVFASIDDVESAKMKELFNEILGENNFVANIIWQKAFAPINLKKTFSTSHDYILNYSKDSELFHMNGIKRSQEGIERYKNPDNDKRGVWQSDNFSVGPAIAEKIYEVTTPNGRKIYPPKGRCWLLTKERFEEFKSDNRIWFGEDGGNVPRIKRFLSEVKDGVTPLTLWLRGDVGDNQESTRELKDLLGDALFTNPKPSRLLNQIVQLGSTKSSIVLDYFAGSGTTGHAVINLNKEDKGTRKYILCEMGVYFTTVTKPRIQKVIYSQNWKDGKPADKDGSPKHIVKYQVLEQYEDVLDNLIVYEGALPENLPIKYLYKPEENGLDNNLDIFTPLSNRIKYGHPTQEGFIDLVETHNYLQGYFVKSIKTATISGKYYKIVETTQGVLVVWRDIALNEDDSEAVISIAKGYQGLHTIEVNAAFATLQLDKNNHLTVGENEIELRIIHKEDFNQ